MEYEIRDFVNLAKSYTELRYGTELQNPSSAEAFFLKWKELFREDIANEVFFFYFAVMSDLQEFVNQQKAKNSFFGSATSSASFPSINGIRSKITSGLNGFSISLSPTVDSDREALTESAGQTNGQLPASRNRRNNGWFSSVSSEDTFFGSVCFEDVNFPQ